MSGFDEYYTDLCEVYNVDELEAIDLAHMVWEHQGEKITKILKSRLSDITRMDKILKGKNPDE